MKIFDASPWGSARMGQGGMYSWNSTFTPGGGFYQGPPMSPEARVQEQAAAAEQQYGNEVAAVEDCFTCTNPDSGDTQYGVTGAVAKELKGKGYRCRKDQCARPGGGGGDAFGSFGGGFFPTAGGIAPGGGLPASAPSDYGGMLSGRRGIPLSPGLGRRALS